MVSVEDTGKGLETGVVDRIFEPMFTTKTHGIGMGLSICRSIIEAHEGRPPPAGTAVLSFTLPCR
jgi:signal transduction histidine kinase